VIDLMKKKFINLISFFLVLSFLVICFVYYNSNTFVKNIDKNRENYLIYLNSYIEKLDKINSSSDFKKRIDNEEFFKKIYKQKQYWELIK
jgi:predicted membrane protein